ncbi:MAG TPA: metallophosphoesterase [Thermoleophilaceae bacterium]
MTALIWLSAMLDAAAALALLGRRRAAWALVPAACAVKLATVAALGAQRFGLLHVLYLDLVVALPIVGLGLLLARRARRRLPVLVAALGLVALAPVGVYASLIEPHRLQTERVVVPVDRARSGDGELRVAVLADVQTAGVGDYERRAFRRAGRLRPHVVLIPGDLFQMSQRRFRRDLPELRRLVASLHAPGGVFVVDGDADDPARLREVVHGTGARLLVNDVAHTRVAGRELTIGGVQVNWRTREARRVYGRLEREPERGDVRIVLAHRPDAALELRRRTRVDLVVAGHTHGGQVVVPGFGPPITKSSVPREVAAGGLHRLGGDRRVYVSRGVGVEHGSHAPHLRLFSPPELTLLRLRG